MQLRQYLFERSDNDWRYCSGYLCLFLEQKENIRIETSVKSYLLKASKNKSLNYLRDKKARLVIQNKLAEESETSYEIPVISEDNHRLQEIIKKAVESLPEKCREIYILSKEKTHL